MHAHPRSLFVITSAIGISAGLRLGVGIGLGLGMGSLGLLAGCGGDSADGNGNGSSIAVEVGTGTLMYEPIVADQALPLVAGPQGGHHFFMHTRMKGLAPGDPAKLDAPGNPSTLFRVFDEQGNRVDGEVRPYRRGYWSGDDGWLELPSGRIIVVSEPAVTSLVGHRVRLRVEIEDADKQTGADEVWVNAYEQPLVPDDGGTDSGTGADAGPE